VPCFHSAQDCAIIDARHRGWPRLARPPAGHAGDTAQPSPRVTSPPRHGGKHGRPYEVTVTLQRQVADSELESRLRVFRGSQLELEGHCAASATAGGTRQLERHRTATPSLHPPVQTQTDPEPPNSCPVPPIPDLAGKRGGNPRFPIQPGPGTGEPPFPDSAGTGKRGPDWPQIGTSGMALCVSTAGTILGWMLPCVLQMQIQAAPHF